VAGCFSGDRVEQVIMRLIGKHYMLIQYIRALHQLLLLLLRLRLRLHKGIVSC
jgi:hypothetical protein